MPLVSMILVEIEEEGDGKAMDIDDLVRESPSPSELVVAGKSTRQ